MAGEITFSFANFNSKQDLSLVVKNIQRDITGPLTEQMTTIAGRMGGAYEGSTIGAKTIAIEVVMKSLSEEDKAVKLRDMATIVQATKGKDEYPLILSDDPTITYWCHIASISTPTRVMERSPDVEFTITFTVSEGVGYGERVFQDVTTSSPEVIPTGTADTYPCFALVAGETLNKVGIATEEDYVYVGEETEEDTPNNLILNDACNSMSTWTKVTTPTFVLENANIASDADITTNDSAKAIQIAKKDGRFYYGNSTNTKLYRGASRLQNFSQSLSDWKLQARIYIDNRYPRSKGKIELYMLNSMGQRIGRFMVKDNGIDLQNLILAEIGSDAKNKDVFLSSRDNNKITKKASDKTKTITTTKKRTVTNKKAGYKKGDTYSAKVNVKENDTENVYTDFYGIITMRKDDNVYKASIQRLDKKGVAYGSPVTTTYTDTENQYTNLMKDFAGIAVYFGEMPIEEDLGTSTATYKQNIMQLTDVKVWKITNKGEEPEAIAEVGDEILFDLDSGKVYKNGAPMHTAIGSSYFSIPPSQGTLIGLMPPPSEKNKWTLQYIPRYL